MDNRKKMRILKEVVEGEIYLDLILTHNEMDGIDEYSPVFCQTSCKGQIFHIGIRKQICSDKEEEEDFEIDS